ncbi:MAG TPA: GNAT family N-acetyltransferase [Polyangiaceae bacterium]|nr:GNAT family N-acetyltransferase [Polyangiaceae bacterium]
MASRAPIADLEFRTHERIADIGASVWSSLAGQDCQPFLRYEWLSALEDTGCIEPSRGWLAMHVAAYQEGELVAVAPAYVKRNSEGEFVFDHSIARYAQGNLGIDYYPKLIVAVPFTPATGPRVLIKPGQDSAAILRGFAAALPQIAERIGASSCHVLFPEPAQAAGLEAEGYLPRHGLQFHWRNPGYQTFDDFLARFNSKRRNQIRREIREMRDRQIDLSVLTGERIRPELVDFIFDFYRSTVQKFFYGKQYLNRAFFEQVCQSMPEHLHVVIARDASSQRPFAGAFNLLGKQALYGRYWGALEERPFVHFNVCFYRGIQECIERGLSLFEPGAGGEHKLARGFEPARTFSAHSFRDRRLTSAVADFLERERGAISAHLSESQTESGLRAFAPRA